MIPVWYQRTLVLEETRLIKHNFRAKQILPSSGSRSAAICTRRQRKHSCWGCAQKVESAWLIHFAAKAGGELEIVLLFVFYYPSASDDGRCSITCWKCFPLAIAGYCPGHDWQSLHTFRLFQIIRNLASS